MLEPSSKPKDIKVIAKQIAQKTPVPQEPRFQGKGTRARLNTAAEKHMFRSQYSK